MHACRFTPTTLRTVFLIGIIIATAGCSVTQTENVILETKLPPSFSLHGTASYEPAIGETCTLPSRKGRNVPGKKFFDQELQEQAQTASFKVPLTDKANGCPLVLKSFEFMLEGQYGPRAVDIGRAYARLSFRNQISTSTPPTITSPLPVFKGQCQWFFRTIGSNRYIVKLLKCRSVDDYGKVENSSVGGALQRDQVSGKTVKLDFELSKEEQPAVGDNWVRFPNGWKRCMGESLEDQYAFCRGNTTDFKPFKMPDGRDCTVYPSCDK